ncbi:MAG: hypothetical protein QOF94_710 [Acidobacteriaceae bacterium]|jgi:hypothetical protein
MNDLLQVAVDAHGGLSRWNQLKRVKASLSITGAIWQMKGKPDILKHVSIEAELHKERLTTHFNGKGIRTVFEPNRVIVETEGGRLVDNRDDPRSAFRGHTRQTAWDDVHVAYFSSYALWNYLTIPFLYTYSGFVTEELAPWQENGEQWRPLKVTVPDSVASHSREQVAYFGPDGLLRRHAYTVDIMGGAAGLNYASDLRNVDGIVVPTKRRVYASDANNQKIPEPVLVAIDIREIAFSGVLG